MLDTQPSKTGRPALPPPIPPPVVAPAPAHKVGRRSAPRGVPALPGLDRFHDHEEAFFSEEEHFASAEASAAESFDDLDEGHVKPLPFWKRIFKKLSTAGRPPSARSRKAHR
jgi:hypothetical protein